MKVILHVEDDPSLQNLVRIALSRLAGYEVDTAGDGILAQELARQRTPDLILLDLDLPGMNGVETLHALRVIEALAAVPVIFLTASADPQTHASLLRLGARFVLQKPFRPRELAEIIRRTLSGDAAGAAPGEGGGA